jgi:hypothetical protein
MSQMLKSIKLRGCQSLVDFLDLFNMLNMDQANVEKYIQPSINFLEIWKKLYFLKNILKPIL